MLFKTVLFIISSSGYVRPLDSNKLTVDTVRLVSGRVVTTEVPDLVRLVINQCTYVSGDSQGSVGTGVGRTQKHYLFCHTYFMLKYISLVDVVIKCLLVGL
jgi:hypothetical protein